MKEKITRLVTPVSLTEKTKPIMPLRHGHLAQLLASGMMMNGVVFDKDNSNPLLVKGMTKKVVATFIEDENGIMDEITDKINKFISSYGL